MQYKFKQIKLCEVERLWLTELLKLNFDKIDVKSLRVKLWNKIPKDFRPNAIDYRLVRDNRLTLVGLWYVDPQSPIFSHVSKTIKTWKALILENQRIERIRAKDVADRVGITEREAEIVLMLIYDLGGFFGAGGGSSARHGWREATLPQNDSAYDEFLKFENLEKKMEEFFLAHAPHTNVTDKKFSKGQSMPTSPTYWKQPSSRDTWNDIYEDFEVKKPTFAKEINFVTEQYKRKAIFRDIEHAYILAKSGFSKPAVILAGSVIEELLRLYLQTKDVKPSKDTFESFIKACEDNSLLKGPINRLSDSVRYFRNLVHLQGEKSRKYAISKHAAVGAVSSIFTIASDF